MALSELALAKKRTEKVMRRRAHAARRYRNSASYIIGRTRLIKRMNAEELKRRHEHFEAQRAETRAAIKERMKPARSGFLDRVKSSLRAMIPRRTP